MSKSVIISSIGNAKPSIVPVLSEVFGTSTDIATRMIYTAPTALLHHIDMDLAQKTHDLLTTLGLEVTVQDSTEPLPNVSEIYDLAVYIENPLLLPLVSNQLSEFLGCAEKEAFNLLLNEPSVVLGGVSMATAEALTKRIDAEVIASNPKTDYYTLKIKSKDPSFLAQLQATLKNLGIPISLKKTKILENLDYKTSQEIWRRFNPPNQIQIINQSYQRYEIILEDLDTSQLHYRNALHDLVGMPLDIIDDVLDNLPIQLDESVNKTILYEKLALYNKAGFKCLIKPIPFGVSILSIEEIQDIENTHHIIKQFYTDAVLPTIGEKWVSPKPHNHILTRYIACQLESIGCVVETKFIEDEQH